MSTPPPTNPARPHQRLLGRGAFLFVGLGLFALKFVVDRVVAHAAFGRAWSLRSYLIPEQAYSPAAVAAEDGWFLVAMLAVAVPFVLVGLTFTVRRLRDAGLSPRLAVLFFAPFVNLLFFAVLALLPSLPTAAAVAADPTPAGSAPPRGSMLDRVMPLDGTRSMFAAALYVTPIGPLAAFLGVFVLRHYGWGLFVGLPFVVALLATLLHTSRVRRSLTSCFAVGVLALSACGIGILVCAIEGAVCLVMLFPLAVPIALSGAAVGYSVQRRPAAPGGRGFPVQLVGLLVVLPLLMGAERLVVPGAAVFSVATAVDVDAPPETVWRHVVSFSEIPRPAGWFFATGIAYPVRARIEGAGVGACRYCEFSTGPFVEPITAWDEPRLLAFDVTHNPPPMREWGPYRIHPPHLENYLRSRGGQFHLLPLPGGRTRLEGTTWYQHHMFPEAYWRLWGDYVIHRIHRRVLDHVKELSEDAAHGPHGSRASD